MNESRSSSNLRIVVMHQVCAMDNGLWFWVCGDALLQGAALNAVPIAEELLN